MRGRREDALRDDKRVVKLRGTTTGEAATDSGEASQEEGAVERRMVEAMWKRERCMAWMMMMMIMSTHDGRKREKTEEEFDNQVQAGHNCNIVRRDGDSADFVFFVFVEC